MRCIPFGIRSRAATGIVVAPGICAWMSCLPRFSFQNTLRLEEGQP